MDYPQDFPGESRAKVEAAKIRAGRKFDSERSEARWSSEVEGHFRNYLLTPFLVFAKEACALGLWPVDKMDESCQEFLRRLTIDAYVEKGRAAGLSDPISNWNGTILWEFEQELKKTPQWRRYENLLLKCANGARARAIAESVGQDKTAHTSEPDYGKLETKILEEQLDSVKSSLRLLEGEFSPIEPWVRRELRDNPDWAGWTGVALGPEADEIRRLESKRQKIALELSTRRALMQDKTGNRTAQGAKSRTHNAAGLLATRSGARATKASRKKAGKPQAAKRSKAKEAKTVRDKGNPKLLADKDRVSLRTAERYLGISERQRQNLMKQNVLAVVGGGQNRQITTESLKRYLPPENPQ